jgi:hypothetical protein
MPETHLSMGDYSVDIPENIADNYGADVDPTVAPGTPETIDTTDVVISNRSALNRTITRPLKLFYHYDIGGGTRYVRDEMASTSDLVSAAQTIRQHIMILDGTNNATTDLLWDLEVTGLGPVPNSFVVRLYMDKVGTRGQTFKVKYQAVNGTNDREPNRREVINATETLSEGVDYTLTDLGASGYRIDGLAAADMAPAIGLFSDSGAAGSVTISASDIDFGGSNIVSLLVSGAYRPVQDVVGDINALSVAYTATALSESARCQLATGVISIATTGTVLRHDRLAHVRYTDQFRIRPLLPAVTSAREPWYPRITKGCFVRSTTTLGSPFRYLLRDFDYQAWNTSYGPPYKDRALEEPRFLDSQRVRVRFAPIRSISDITLIVDGVEQPTLLDQVDLANGIIFLTRSIEASQSLFVSYVFEERAFVYQGVDLNPTLIHTPEFFKRYVGVYIIPHKRLGPSDTYERTIYHMTRDSAQEICAAVAALELPDGNNAEAKLLAIYSIRQTEDPGDLDVVDTRRAGGGIRHDLERADVAQDEALFYADVGGHYDGEPYPDAATLIVEMPVGLPGDAGEDHETIYDSFGLTGQLNLTGWVNPTGLLNINEMQPKLRKYAEGGAFVIEDFYPEP